MNNYKSSVPLKKVGVTFRGKAVPVPEPEKEPEPEMWVILDIYADTPITLPAQKSGTVNFNKSSFLISDDNFLNDIRMEVIDHNNNDSVTTSGVLIDDDDVVAFLTSNGYNMAQVASSGYIHKVQSAYWYGEKLNKYLTSVEQLEVNGKTFKQYTSDDVLVEYEEWFDINKYPDLRIFKLTKSWDKYTLNSENNTAYGIAYRFTNVKNAVFLSVGWACKMRISEYNTWIRQVYSFNTEYSRSIEKDREFNLAVCVTQKAFTVNGTLLK